MFPEDALCVAFHPSGFHIVVGFFDKIQMMNVFKNSVEPYPTDNGGKEINVKQCREIVFSHGGHLFACQNQTFIQVYKFYTAELPVQYLFKSHMGHIRSIAWLDDDTGFVSSAGDSTINVWKLNPAENEVNPIWHYKLKNVDFTCVATFKPEGEKNSLVYATGQDKTIRELSSGKKGVGFEEYRFEQNVTLSQIALLRDRKAMFTGVNETNKPGSIQVIKYLFDKIDEV